MSDSSKSSDASEPTGSTDTPAPAEAARSSRLSTVRVARLAVALALVAALALGATAAWKWQELRERDDLRADVLRTAKEDAVTVTSYDYRDLDAYFDALGKVSTDEYAEKYADSTEMLGEVITSTKSVVTSEVIAAGVASVDDETAVVVLFVDQTVKNKTLEAPRVDRNRLEMTLHRKDDDWLISSLELR